MIDMPTDENVGKILRWAHENDLFTISLCHGPGAFLATALNNQKFLYEGYKMAVFPDAVDNRTPMFGYLPGKMTYGLSEKLKSLGVISGFDELATQSSSVASSVQALNSSSLGNEINATIGGVQGLNTTTDAAISIGLLTENLPGLRSQIVQDVSSSKSDLDAITGNTVDNSFNDLVFTSATAEGVKAGVNFVASPTTQQMTTILQNVVPEQYAGQVSSLVTNSFSDFSSNLSTAVGSFTSSFSDLLGSVTGNVLQDVILQNDTRPINIIENLGVSSATAGEVLVLLQSNRTNKAVELLTSLTGKSAAEVEAVLATVPTSLEDQIDKRNVSSSSTGVYDVSDKNNEWDGANTPSTFFDVIARVTAVFGFVSWSRIRAAVRLSSRQRSTVQTIGIAVCSPVVERLAA